MTEEKIASFVFKGKSFEDTSDWGEATRFYKISAAHEEQLNVLEKLFAQMELLGRIGASREIKLFVDGDGAIGFRFSKHNNDEFVFRKLDYDEVMEQDNGYGYVTIPDDYYDSKFDLG